MLNVKAQPASGGARLARYHWHQAVAVEGEELARLLLGAVRPDDPSAWADAKERLVDAIRETYREEYRELIDGLATAMRAVGEWDYLRAVTRLRDLHDYDFEGIEEAIDGLRTAFAGVGQSEYREAVEQIADVWEAIGDESGIRAEAELTMIELSKAARDPLMVERFGAEYRRDTSDQLAALLGIEPAAIPRLEDVEQLLQGRRADGRPIPGKHQPGHGEPTGSLDLIFSPDKSVSVTWGLASEEERRLIGRAHRDAVHEAMLGIARQAGTVRTRAGGQDERATADITWIAFHHKFSRTGDVQLHTHVSALNVTQAREGGRVGSLDARQLHGYYDVAKDLYHRHLAQELTGLGLEARLERVGHGRGWNAAVVGGIPERVLERFSGRTEEAERAARDYLAARGVDIETLSPSQQSTWTTRAAAATRRPMFYVPGAGHEVWLAIAEGQGWAVPPHFLDPALLSHARHVQQQVEERTAEVTRPFSRDAERMQFPHLEQQVHVARGLWH